MGIRGALDRVEPCLVAGWLAVHGAENSSLEALLDGAVIARCPIDVYREDLEQAGIGDGKWGFFLQLPESLTPAERLRVRIRICGTEIFLQTEVGSSVPPGPLAIPTPITGREGAKPKSESRLRGLWIDRQDWLDVAQSKISAGDMSMTLAHRIFEFVLNGYVILRNAVDPAVIDRINADVERVWSRPRPEERVETFEPDGVHRIVCPEPSLRSGRTKLLDLYATCASAREAIASPAIVDFLSCIFEDKPLAFQSLSSWRGSGQDMHKDTDCVRVLGNPLALAASWIALQDIEPGTGELEYYVGSHRTPDYLFGEVGKWMMTPQKDDSAEQPRPLKSLVGDSVRYRLRKSSFLAKKGDVLIWHSELAHGESKILDRDKTRKSLVAHYCPSSLKPAYLVEPDTTCTYDEIGQCRFVSNHVRS